MSKILFTSVLLILAISLSAAEESTRLARHRHRVLHHRYPQTFRYKPGAQKEESRRRGGYRPFGYRPAQAFELPIEGPQSWVAQSDGRIQGKVPQQQHRRPVDIYGSPPVNWPIRPPSGRPQLPNPHDIYGPPAEKPPSSSDDDIGADGFHAEYEYEQDPEEEFDRLQKSEAQGQAQQQQPTSLIRQSEQYTGTEPVRSESQRTQPEEDKIENFEIPLEYLRSTQGV